MKSAAPSGTICPFASAILDIPTGWVLCDGNNGTPNLTDFFIIGAGDYPVDYSAATKVHNHDIQGDGHTHDLVAGSNIKAGTDLATISTSTTVVGTTDNASTDPPYYALAFIMKT